MCAFLRIFIIKPLLTILLLATASISVVESSEPPDDYAPPDTVFNEIILNEDGVTAVDLEGYDWYFDFERAVFVSGYPLSDLEFVFDPIINIPIEERAVNQKRVKPFESGDVTVREDEFVDGNIYAWGVVTVKGWVKGDVVSAYDRVLITETAYIEGDVTAPRVITKEGAVVEGSIIESDNPLGDGEFPFQFSHTFLLVMTIITLSFLFFGFIILTVMPRQSASIESCIVQNKSRSALLGFLIILVLPAIIVLLAITIVGVVLIPLLPVIYAWAMLLGIVATGKALGAYVGKKYAGKNFNLILAGMIGIMILMLPWLLTGAFMGGNDDTSVGFGIFFLVVSILVSLYPILAGLGASFLTRFGFRNYVSGSPFGPKKPRPASPAPAPPPIPDSPFVQNSETPQPDSRISEQNKDS